MANNPVQVVLNSSSYIEDVQTVGGGNHKDFFADRDSQFAQHKAMVRANLAGIRAQLASSRREVSYVHVTLRPDAWAKSHRPVQAFLRPEAAPVVGSSDVGELLVELTPESVDEVVRSLDLAEEETRRALDSRGVNRVKPTRLRSEVGAVGSVRAHEASDRRDFSSATSAAWLADPRSGGLFLLQLFESVSMLRGPTDSSNSREGRRRREFSRLVDRLELIDDGIRLDDISEHWDTMGIIALRMPGAPGVVTGLSVDLHETVLSMLDLEPLVRRVWLPPLIGPANSESSAVGGAAGSLVAPETGESYPVVGVIDTGVADVPALSGWIVGAADAVDPALQDLSHGTFIAGLLADDGVMNNHPEMEERPCKVFDLGLHVTDPALAQSVYPQGFVDFLSQLDAELSDARDAGVRVLNMSLSIEQHVRDDSYSLFADAIDEMADKYDLLFVLPTGNLAAPQFRAEWPRNPDDALAALANYRHAGADRLFQPADSLRSLSVGALSPGSKASPYVRPTTYTRRGPGMGLGAKPELAHIGGAASQKSGLESLDPLGGVVADCGTSFAAPLAAKTLANIEHAIAGDVSRETILALAIHGASIPEALKSPKLSRVARDFVGYGMPPSASEILSTGDDAITLVFNASMTHRRELSFDFQWPQALVGAGGKCRGDVSMSLVYRPEIDLRFGSEAVRVNLEAYLRQERVDLDTGEISYRGFFKADNSSVMERERIAAGQKWSPSKKWKRVSKHGVGTSSQWRIVVEPLARSGYLLPSEGVPFSLVLTIADPAGAAPVFNQMRRNLQASSVQIADIQVSQRLQPRL